MEDWCADHRFVAPARLDGFALLFLRRSTRWEAGAADVVEADGAATWGALYEVSGADLAALAALHAVVDADDRGARERHALGVQLPVGLLDDVGLVLQQEDDGAPNRAHVDRLIRRVEDEHTATLRSAPLVLVVRREPGWAWGYDRGHETGAV